MQIYVVTGMCGEYSDRSEWVVIAYPTEELAQQHVVLATEKAQAVMQECNDVRDSWDGDTYEKLNKIRARPNPYDLNTLSDYYDTKYYYTIIDLNDALP